MSRITSLGIHAPAALPYCLSENLLADPVPPNAYSWTTTPFLPNEELLVTSTAVIWSQGGVIRRVFRFEVEKQPVIQAVLTWFPSDDPADAPLPPEDTENPERSTYQGGPGEGVKRKKEDNDVDGRHGVGSAKKRISTWNSKSRTYATQLGNFPQTKYYAQQMSGGGSAFATEEEEDPTPQGRARALVVFLKTQAHVYFLSGKSYVIHIPFEIQRAMPSPRGLMLQIKSSSLGQSPKDTFSQESSFGATSVLNFLPSARPDFPRLYSLTDPLADLGMAITSNGSVIDPNEELIFISPNSELDSSPYTVDPTGSKNFLSSDVIFAVTRNIKKEELTIWFVRYIPQETPSSTHRRSSSGTTTRRRSSFGPNTGATTPTAGAGPGAIPLAASLASSSQASEDLAAEFEDKPTRRTSRRVSSLVARSDLSQNVDRLAFSDMASAGSSFQHDRLSVNDDPPVDDLLKDLNMTGLGLGFGNMGLNDGNRLRNELLFTKLESFAYQISPKTADTRSANGGARGRSGYNNVSGNEAPNTPKVFTLLAPSTVLARESNAFGHSDQKVVLCIFNKNDDSLLQLTFAMRAHTVVTSPHTFTSAASFSKRMSSGKADTKMYTPLTSDVYHHQNVADAVKISDGGVSRILILKKAGELIMYSPWSPAIPLVLPATLARWSPNLVGGSLKKKKGGFTRTLSTSPEKYLALAYAEEGGKVSVVDENMIGHRIGIQLNPREAVVKLALEAVKTVTAAMLGILSGEAIGVVWMEVSRSGLGVEDDKFSRRRESTASVGEEAPQSLDEWRAFAITILSLGVPYISEKPREKPRKGRTFSRSASMVASLEWEEMLNDEGEWGPGPEYLRSPAWEWMVEEQEENELRKSQQPPSSLLPSPGKSKIFSDSLGGVGRKNTLIPDSIAQARKFIASKAAKKLHEHFPSGNKDPELKKIGLALVLITLHLVREELKLDITMEMSVRRMTPLLAQLARWLGWRNWIDAYSVEDVEVEDWAFDECKEDLYPSFETFTTDDTKAKITPNAVSSEPYPPPSIYEWLISSLQGKCTLPFLSLQDIVTPTPSSPIAGSRHRNSYTPPPHPGNPNGAPSINLTKPIYAKLTPRTKTITELYATLITSGKSHNDVVALMVKKKMTAASLERLPEGVALPLREAIARCQEQPPTTWGPHALDLVSRRDIKMLIAPGKTRKEFSKWQTVSLPLSFPLDLSLEKNLMVIVLTY